MDTQFFKNQNNTYDTKKILVTVSFILAVIVLIVYAREKISHMPTPASVKHEPSVSEMRALPPLPKADEATLQKQLQEIVKGGKVSDCASLSDPRYQYACNDFFKIKK
jgi:hypothetical protein